MEGASGPVLGATAGDKKALTGPPLADANFIVLPTFWAAPLIGSSFFIFIEAAIDTAIDELYP